MGKLLYDAETVSYFEIKNTWKERFYWEI